MSNPNFVCCVNLFQEEVTAEESTDGEIETQAYNQDSQDSMGEVSMLFSNHLNRSTSCSYVMLKSRAACLCGEEDGKKILFFLSSPSGPMWHSAGGTLTLEVVGGMLPFHHCQNGSLKSIHD